MRKFSLTISVLCLSFVLGACSSDVPQNNIDVENSAERALPPPSDEDEPVVLAAEIDEVEKDVLLVPEFSTEQRLLAVEEKVEKLRQELNLLRPAIKELISKSLQNGDIEKPNAAPAVPQSVFSVEEEASVTEKEEQPALGIQQGSSVLSDIRTEHSHKTRFVIDLTQKTPYTYHLDEVENILSIELPQAKLLSVMSETLANSPNIISYQTQILDGGSLVLIQLKEGAQILNTEALPATQELNSRIYFDIGT